MNYLKIFVSFLFFVLLVTLGLSFFLSTNQKVERTVIINASAPVIYNHLIKLENFNKFSVWSQQDSTAVYTLSGKDGTVGASTSWKGSPEISGEGKAESVFLLNETNKETTSVTWTFKMATPRPWNIFNLFYSLDKQMGKDFEDGLTALKNMIELNIPDSINTPNR